MVLNPFFNLDEREKKNNILEYIATIFGEPS